MTGPDHVTLRPSTSATGVAACASGRSTVVATPLDVRRTSVVGRLQRFAEIANLAGAPVLTHEFSPQGFSAALIAPGSTIVVHTWPENGLLTVDVWTLDPQVRRLMNDLLRWHELETAATVPGPACEGRGSWV